MATKDTLSFEEAHEKLEKILAAMNGGKLSLEESLNLFEKAEKLVRHCEAHLKSAEQKIEEIVKGKQGEILLDSEQKPKLAPFGGQEIPF